MGCRKLQLNDCFSFIGNEADIPQSAQHSKDRPAVFSITNKTEAPVPSFSYYSYDKYGRLSKITDPRGRQTSFTYDALGRQLTRTLPMGQSESQVYNTLGQLESKTDFKGVLTEFTYDNFGRLTQKTHSYQNDTDTVTYTYDELGRQSTVTDKDGGETTYNYTKVGSRSSVTLPNGAKTTYTYDDLNRLTNLTNKNASDNLLSSYTYTLAPNGRRTAVVEKTLNDDNTFLTRNIAYTYDALNRLSSESSTSSKSSLDYTSEYTYDLTGNRLKHTFVSLVPFVVNYSYNANDQLTLESNSVKGDTNYSYDTNGSMIGKVNTIANESYLYTYNLQNRLSTATINRMEDTSLVEITSSYLYNQSGIRVGSNSSTTIDNATPTVKNRKYLLDSGMTGYSQVLEELDATNNTLVKSYTIGDDVLRFKLGTYVYK